MPLCFADLLALASARAQSLDDEGVLSLAVPLAPLDPLALLPLLPGHNDFRFLWDGAPGLCLAAAGRCQSLELSGPRRFELAQRFASLSLSRLGAEPQGPAAARPRVLLAFGFFDTPLDASSGAVPGVQAVLPRWQLSRHGQHCWLRLQATLGGAVTARSLAEELWETAAQLQQAATTSNGSNLGSATVRWSSPWQQHYGPALERGLELVESGGLTKLVLAVRQQLQCDRPLEPLELIPALRQQQAGSCRLLWQRHSGSALVGASPERLLTVRQGQLRCDALAGTAAAGAAACELLRSAKDRHEHELVVEAIAAALGREGLAPRRPRHPRLARHGHLAHLHTPITAELNGGQHPLAVAAALHPTPAVAGLPRREAMAWLRSLEPFERGHYAAPIGWIDSEGDTDLRVAIRCGVVQGNGLELTAGAGLVRGSTWQRELNEVGLKLQVLQRQLSLPAPAAARW